MWCLVWISKVTMAVDKALALVLKKWCTDSHLCLSSDILDQNLLFNKIDKYIEDHVGVGGT